MRTIRAIAVDIWRAGLPTLDCIVAHESSRLEVHFVHCESLTLPTLPRDRRTTALKTYKSRDHRDRHYGSIRDISSYGYSLADALDDIQPDVGIFVSLHGFFHRWGNLMCTEAGVPSVLVMHGLRPAWGKEGTSGRSSPIYLARRFVYYTILFALYARDGMRSSTALTLHEASKEYCELIFRHSEYVSRPGSRRNIDYDTLCVVDPSDEEYFRRRYGIAESTRVVSTGPIELSDLRDPFLRLRSENESHQQILFISQPVGSSGIMDRSRYIDLIHALSRVASDIGNGVLVRAHPRDDADVIDQLRAGDVAVSTDRPLEKDFSRARIVVGLCSTALVTAHHLGFPVVALQPNDAPRFRYLEGRERVMWVRINDVFANPSAVRDTLAKAFDVGMASPGGDQWEDPVETVLEEITRAATGSDSK